MYQLKKPRRPCPPSPARSIGLLRTRITMWMVRPWSTAAVGEDPTPVFFSSRERKTKGRKKRKEWGKTTGKRTYSAGLSRQMQVIQIHSRLFKEYIASTNKSLSRRRPEPSPTMLLNLVMELLIAMTHPSFNQFFPVFRR